MPLKVGLIFGFLGYMRLPNLAPQTAGEFDQSRHTSWNDIVLLKEGIVVKIKWSKTLQSVKEATPVPLPALWGSVVCPRSSWSEYVAALPEVPHAASTPLLFPTVAPRRKIITAPKFRAMFNRVVAAAGLCGEGLTPHSLRRGGATASFLSGVPVSHIKAHGTWRSSAIEGYLLQTPRFNTPVAKGF